MSDATLVSATLAGVIASTVEGVVTYPLEYLKVREQTAVRPLRHPLPAKLEIPKLTSVFYSGWSPFVVGNALKTIVRFNLFNSATKFMADGGQVSAPAVVVSGTMAGIAETMIIVPFESIKTTMIEASSLGLGAARGSLPPLGSHGTHAVAPPEDGHGGVVRGSAAHGAAAQRSDARADGHARGKRAVRPPAPVRPTVVSGAHLHEVVPLQSMWRTMRHMYEQRGLRAFVQGFNPTVWRQVANSSIRFTTYNFWTQMFSLEGEEGLSLFKIVTGAAMVSACEVALTQPLDVVKSRMQTTNGIKLYGNSLLCAYRVFSEEGWRRLWSGALPRWMRVWLSGGIMWAAYEATYSRLSKQMHERPFQ